MRLVEAQGAQVPAIGLGTWRLPGLQCREVMERALTIGYRHFDTAPSYHNEAEVGAALRLSNIAREDLWVTTKLDPASMAPDRVPHAVRDSLRRLGLDFIDLLMIHWPSPDIPMYDTLAAMQRLQDEGVTRYLGVCNFTPNMLAEALTLAPILSIQVEHHPYLEQRALLTMAQRHELVFVAYSPLAQGRVAQDAKLQEIGKPRGMTPAQVALCWLTEQHNVAAIPKASSEAHLRSNYHSQDFELSADEVRRVPSFQTNLRLCDPELAPDWNA